jgi:hypothetical protein
MSSGKKPDNVKVKSLICVGMGFVSSGGQVRDLTLQSTTNRTDMKMQTCLKNALRHKEILKA